jgi:dTDP-glucose 4,6-dehydratase
MRLLITGGCGFLGAHIVEHILKSMSDDTEIVVLDKMTYASSGYDRLRDIGRSIPMGLPARVHVLGCDLSQPIPAGVAREIGHVDYVIHAAAETHVDRSIEDPVPFLKTNVLGTHHLLWWARGQKNLKRILCVSTDEVYGPVGWDDPGNVETDAIRPANPYAAAKAGGEALCMAYSNTYRLPITIVTTMNLVGERQHPEKFVPMVIRKALAGETVLIHADPTRTRSGSRYYIHARNYASALQFLINRVENKGSLPIKLHVSGERELSNLDMASVIADSVGKHLYYELVDFHSSRPGHDLRYALDDSAIRAMGWTQPVTFFESLDKTVRWYLGNRQWLGPEQ